jgi:hypothetical protein
MRKTGLIAPPSQVGEGIAYRIEKKTLEHTGAQIIASRDLACRISEAQSPATRVPCPKSLQMKHGPH